MNATDGNRPDDAPIRILGVGGSTRRHSKSRVALVAALRLAEEAGAETVLADVRSLDLPIYDADRPMADYPESVQWLLAEARRADAFVFCSPTYHGTVSGAVKNALDILDYLIFDRPEGPGRSFDGRPIGLMACGGGAQNVINALYHSVRALDGLVVPTVVSVHNNVVDLETGQIRDEHTVRRLRTMTEQVVDLARRLRPASVVNR